MTLASFCSGCRHALVLVTPFNTMWLLGAGSHAMLLEDSVQGSTCGLLPFGVAVREIASHGLQWDLGGEWYVIPG
jgi:thiamine pyrophosphokinase